MYLPPLKRRILETNTFDELLLWVLILIIYFLLTLKYILKIFLFHFVLLFQVSCLLLFVSAFKIIYYTTWGYYLWSSYAAPILTIPSLQGTYA